MANYSQVEQDIIDSFRDLLAKKSFSDVSVSEIAKGAKITRRGFYNHFCDKYEVVDRIFEHDIFPYVLGVTNISEWYKGSIYICDYLDGNRAYYQKLMPMSSQNGLQEEFHKLTEKQMELLIPEVLNGRRLSDNDFEFLTQYYYYAYLGLVESFINGTLGYSSEQFVDRWKALLENSLHNYLDIFSK